MDEPRPGRTRAADYGGGHLAIDKAKGNLGLARHHLSKIESELVV